MDKAVHNTLSRLKQSVLYEEGLLTQRRDDAVRLGRGLFDAFIRRDTGTIELLIRRCDEHLKDTEEVFERLEGGVK